MADYISFEIQAEIMKRLPTKSLMQFRSVSKQWKSLIDSSKFIADYSFIHTHQHHLLVSYRVSENSEQKFVSFVDDDTFPHQKCSLPVLMQSSLPMILGSSQGLFCLYSINECPNENVKAISKAVLWNPSVRKSVEIDVPDVIEPTSYLDIGFGVCPHTTDPKIVKIKFSYSVSNFISIFTPVQFEVYTLSSRVWRSIPAINQFHQSITLEWKQVVINGFIYWLASDSGTNMILIVSFDIMNEKFMEVSLPNTLACSRNKMFISKLKESLVVVELVDEAEKQVYGVWMMDPGVPNTFTKLLKIISPLASLQARLLGFRKNIEPIFKMRSNDSDTEELVVTKVKSAHINYIGISLEGICFGVSSYMETLLLLDY